MKKNIKYTELSDEVLMENRLSTFGKGVDKNIIEEHVTSYGNFLWHLFTWGEYRSKGLFLDLCAYT